MIASCAPTILRRFDFDRVAVLIFLTASLAIALLPLQALAVNASGRGADFEHLTTGFPLNGAHRRVTCETCHSRGIFKGTPRQCASCHVRGSGIAMTFKPVNHIPTTAACSDCHSDATWHNGRYRHSEAIPGACATCHNNVFVSGKPATHIPTTTSCDSCHSTRIWSGAVFSHSTVAPGTCASCHNGVMSTGKPNNHIPTALSCDNCHRTTVWTPSTFTHSLVTSTPCAICHNGVYATGQPSGHIATGGSPCSTCHLNTRAWSPAYTP